MAPTLAQRVIPNALNSAALESLRERAPAGIARWSGMIGR